MGVDARRHTRTGRVGTAEQLVPKQIRRKTNKSEEKTTFIFLKKPLREVSSGELLETGHCKSNSSRTAL